VETEIVAVKANERPQSRSPFSRFLFCALLVCSFETGARSQAAKESSAPSPAQMQKIVAAKSVFLQIARSSSEGTVLSFWGVRTAAYVPAFEELSKAVRKWKRFVIVDDVSKADLVLVVVEWEDFHRWGRTVVCRDWLLVFDGGALPTEKSQPLWQGDREQWGQFGGCSGAGQPVKELRKVIEKAEKAESRH